MMNVLKVILFCTALVLIYLIYNSIKEYPENDAKIKTLYGQTVKQLIEVRSAQFLFKERNNRFAPDFETLNKFIDTAHVAYSGKQDSLIPFKDSLFGGSKAYPLGRIYNGFKQVNLSMKLGEGEIKDSANQVTGKNPLFTAYITKRALLDGFEQEIIDRERYSKNRLGILDDSIYVGNLEAEDFGGNWPKEYEAGLSIVDHGEE